MSLKWRSFSSKTTAILFTALIHAGVGILLFANWDNIQLATGGGGAPPSPTSETAAIPAQAIDHQQLEAELNRLAAVENAKVEAEQKRIADQEKAVKAAEQKRIAEEKKIVELQKKQAQLKKQQEIEKQQQIAAAALAQKKRIAEEQAAKAAEQKRIIEEKKALEIKKQQTLDKKKQQEIAAAAEKKRLAEQAATKAAADAKAAAEAKAIADAKAAAAKAAGEKATALANAAANNAALSAIEGYGNQIGDKVRAYWNLSEGYNGLMVTVSIMMDESGRPKGKPNIIESSGNPAFDQEAVAAIIRAAPFPLPKDNLLARQRLLKEGLIFDFSPQ